MSLKWGEARAKVQLALSCGAVTGRDISRLTEIPLDVVKVILVRLKASGVVEVIGSVGGRMLYRRC